MKKLTLLFLLVMTTSAIAQRSEENYYYVENYNESTAKKYLDSAPLDEIEGIWQSTNGFRYAIEKAVENGYRAEGKYRMIVLDNTSDNLWWKPTYIKAYLEYSAVNSVFTLKYFTNYSEGGNLTVQTNFGFLENPAMFTFTTTSGEKISLIKLYPQLQNSPSAGSNSANLETSSGTGFAISSNGFIVTNYHVIEGAQDIKIRGLYSDFSNGYQARVVFTDERNDLALLQIVDPSFRTFGEIPYGFGNQLADVGENVFVLGYPLIYSMGTEIKLTNGIVSAKTGFGGDVSTYQISAPIQPGNSGGPLFDTSGNIIGVVNAKHTEADNAGYAIKVSYLKNLVSLLDNPPSLVQHNSLGNKSLSEKVKVLKDFVFIVSVNESAAAGGNSGAGGREQATSNNNSQYYINQGQAKFNNGDYDAAFEDFNQAISSDPNSLKAFWFRGLIYSSHYQNYSEAIKDFTKVIQMEPEFENGYFRRGLVHYHNGNKVEAIRDFTKTLELNSSNDNALFLRAIVKSDLNDKIGALNDYNRILALEDKAEPYYYNMSTVYNNKAYALVGLERYSEALPFVNKALDMEKDQAYIWDTRGEIYYHLGNYKKSIKDMDRALAIEQSDNSYYIRGLARIKTGDNESGCSDLSKAGELGKAEAYEAMGNYCK